MRIGATMRLKLEQRSTTTAGFRSTPHPPAGALLAPATPPCARAKVAPQAQPMPCRVQQPGQSGIYLSGDIAPSHHTLSLRGMVAAGFAHPIPEPGLLRPSVHGPTTETLFPCARSRVFAGPRVATRPAGTRVASRDIPGGISTPTGDLRSWTTSVVIHYVSQLLDNHHPCMTSVCNPFASPPQFLT